MKITTTGSKEKKKLGVREVQKEKKVYAREKYVKIEETTKGTEYCPQYHNNQAKKQNTFNNEI